MAIPPPCSTTAGASDRSQADISEVTAGCRPLSTQDASPTRLVLVHAHARHGNNIEWAPEQVSLPPEGLCQAADGRRGAARCWLNVGDRRLG